MQTAIVIIIVALAGYYLVRRFYKNVQRSNTEGCSGDCACCSMSRKNTCQIEDHSKKPERSFASPDDPPTGGTP